MIATLKHFPGHGDTDVDSHLGLPVIKHPRERLERSSSRLSRRPSPPAPDAVMTAHIEMPAIDPSAGNADDPQS